MRPSQGSGELGNAIYFRGTGAHKSENELREQGNKDNFGEQGT